MHRIISFLIIPVISCSHIKEKSELKIVAGTEIPDQQIPQVIPLFRQNGGKGCTGSVIGKNVILTAAHCIPAVRTHTKYQQSRAFQLAVWQIKDLDFGIIITDFPLLQKPLNILFTPVAKKDRVSIVGYGMRGDLSQPGATEFGVKRLGSNVIKGFTSSKFGDLTSAALNYIVIRGDGSVTSPTGTRSTTFVGDSGGPMLKDGKLVGVCSRGGDDNGGSSRSSFFSKTSNKEVRMFLRQAVAKGADIPNLDESGESDLLIEVPFSALN